MNHLLVFPEELVDDSTDQTSSVRISGERARYLKEFHQLKVGDSKRAIVYKQGEGEVICREVSNGEFRFSLRYVRGEPSQLPFTLVQGLSRPQTIKKILRYGAMLRLERVVFLPTEFGEKSYRQSKILQPENQKYEIVKGLEQIGNPYPPEIVVARSLASYLDELSNRGLKFIAHPEADATLLDYQEELSSDMPREIVMALGPEAGWSDKEVLAFRDAGFSAIHLGSDHLRVEVAFVTMIAQLKLLSTRANPKRHGER